MSDPQTSSVSRPADLPATGHPGVDYPRYHRDRGNLLIHIAAVPLFVVGTAVLAVDLALGHWTAAGLAALVPPLAFAAQAVGHRREPNPPAPFAGPGDFVARLVMEQFVRFPRYVLTGGWWSAWKRG